MARLSSRKYHIIGLFSFFFIVYLVRLFFIQIVHENYFAQRAKSDSVEKVIEYPIRGNVYDRNGKVLVGNEFAYVIMITMRNLNIDTISFCKLMGIDTVEFNKKVKLIKDKEINKGYISFSSIKFAFSTDELPKPVPKNNGNKSNCITSVHLCQIG